MSGLGLWGTIVYAQNEPIDTETTAIPTTLPVEQAIQEADFAFKGTVVKIEYKHSNIPFTFVTYEVEEYLINPQSAKRVTLRFTGGVNPDGTVTTSSSIPLFDIGEQDILFVRNNGVSACPLAECGDGRLRVVSNGIYTDEGKKVVDNGVGGIAYGALVPIEQAINHKVGNMMIGSQYFNSGREQAIFPNKSPITINDFREFFKRKSPESGSTIRSFSVNADINKLPTVNFKPEAPRSTPNSTRAVPAETPEVQKTPTLYDNRKP